jgi:hypothetical protein
VGAFFIDTERGQVATLNQLIAAGLAGERHPPQRPWHRIQGTGDASTLWYAILRKRMHGVFIGTLTIRHGDHYAFLLGEGWEEVPVDEIAVGY